MAAPLRVLQVGLGPLGIQIAGELHRRELGRIVAAVDPALAGKPFGDVTVQPALAAVADIAIDAAIVATVSDLRACAPTLHELAARGIAIVSTCEELSWPWDRHPEVARALAAAAEQHGARILGTGVNPGFVMDALAVAVTTACAEVRRIEIHRIQDATTRRLPFQKKIGATLTRAEFDRLAAAETIRHVGLRESVQMVAASLGLAVERIDETIAPILADVAMSCGLGPIPAGAARGVHQEARAFGRDRSELIALVFRAAIGEPDPRDQIIVDGNPPVDLVIRNGLHGDVATAAVVLNSLRSVVAAKPGLHTMTTLPLAGCARARLR